ncbi:protein ALP1-like [Xenopus laevis]|uniref:Protein ALP1-like n=1 Tax=Xenopus laevis TaxID=8355 RepID=A0A8J1LM03_XENLA|nr:protein ALP1-like [Xenopus laevis]
MAIVICCSDLKERHLQEATVIPQCHAKLARHVHAENGSRLFVRRVVSVACCLCRVLSQRRVVSCFIMEDELAVLFMLIYLYYFLLQEERKKRAAARKYWVHPITSQRLKNGQFHILYSELRRYPEKFQKFFRMSTSSFDELLTILTPGLSHDHTLMRDPISPEERLCLTLRFLATGQSFSSLYFQFLIGRSTISKIVRETCMLMWSELRRLVMPVPDEIGSKYFNYKKYFSIVLMAVVDANYCFTLIDVGAYGSTGDASAFRNSSFGRRLSEGALQLPPPKPLPGTAGPCMPYVFVGDEAFGLTENIMRPYPGSQRAIQKRVFNYRLSRARRMVECAFGILSNKWRVFHTAIQLEPDFVDNVIKAGCVLHNFVRLRDGYNYQDTLTDDIPDIDWAPVRGPTGGMRVRDHLANYFMSPDGSVPWQLNRM